MGIGETDLKGVPGRWRVLALALALLVAAATVASAQSEAAPAKDPGPTMDIYGFAMLDMGYQTGSNHPDWFDVIRPTKLPSFDGEFGKDGHTYASVRQSRLGVKANIPTDAGTIKTIFEFELFGTGVDAGQTTFRLRHAWGEFNGVGAGQTWSPFMDPNVFPNSVEYWGPSGMVFFRNVQIRWQPIDDEHMTFNVALERPGASGDGGNYSDRLEIQNLKGRFPYPDISSSVKWGGDWGYVRAAGILRYMKWDDTLQDQFQLSGHGTGWGINLSSNLNVGPGVMRLQAMYGEGVENYMNDAPADLGAKLNPGNPVTPIKGELLPVTGLVAFYDINWSDSMTSTVGYSSIDISNSNGQAANAFSKGQYALANIMFYPTKGMMWGPELQWGNRKNFIDHFSSEDFRVQVSFKYNFSHTLIGGH
jgi:hypothetical protein